MQLQKKFQQIMVSFEECHLGDYSSRFYGFFLSHVILESCLGHSEVYSVIYTHICLNFTKFMCQKSWFFSNYSIIICLFVWGLTEGQ